MTALLVLLMLAQPGLFTGGPVDAITVNSGVGGLVSLSVESKAEVEAVYPAPKDQFKLAGDGWWMMPTATDSAAGILWWRPMPLDWPQWDTAYAYTYYLVLTPEGATEPLRIEVGEFVGKLK